jgi:hypothetical protein
MAVDLERPPVLGMQRSVAGQGQRIAGEGLHAQLALDAVGGADDGRAERDFSVSSNVHSLRRRLPALTGLSQ